MKGRAAVLLAVCVVAAPAVVAAQSAQEKADAEALFNAARAALAAGNLGEACPKFAESQRKDPAIGTALYLAECYERSGKIASAWAQFRQAEDMANQRHDNRAGLAKIRAEKLSPSKLSIVLAPGADIPGLEVRRDGEIISSAQFGLASPIDGGRHRVVATAPNRIGFNWSGDIAEQHGATTVTIPKLEEVGANVVPTATATATTPIPTATATITPTATTTSTPPPDTNGGMGGAKIAGLVVGGVGLVALGIGTTLGIVAKGNYDATSSSPHFCTDNGCPDQAGVDARNSAKGLADASTVIFIGGAIAMVGGLVVFLVAPKAHASSASSFRLAPFVSGAGNGGGAMLTGKF